MLTDHNCGLIFASSFNDLIHETTHLVLGTSEHNREFMDLYTELGGKQNIQYDTTFDRFLFKIGLAANVGNVTGIQNILTDYHLLQAYRKFSQRILATEGQWEVKGDNKIRLFPTPRGSFPVVIEYIPTVQRFRSPHAREILKRALVAEAKIMLGNSRSKFGNIPAPGGGSLNLNGDALRTEGQAEKDKAVQDALLLSEPLGPILW
jgi:hypothetical protein